MAGTATAREREGGVYTNDIHVRGHHFYADEPVSLGSSDLGPTPVELLSSALAACTSMTLRMYANRKKWPLEYVEVEVNYKKGGDKFGAADIFSRKIVVTGSLSADQRLRLHEIADKCPVHNILEANATINTSIA